MMVDGTFDTVTYACCMLYAQQKCLRESRIFLFRLVSLLSVPPCSNADCRCLYVRMIQNGLFVLLCALCTVCMCVMRMYTITVYSNYMYGICLSNANGKLRRDVLVFSSSCAAFYLVLDTLRLCVPIKIIITIETTTIKRMPIVA